MKELRFATFGKALMLAAIMSACSSTTKNPTTIKVNTSEVQRKYAFQVQSSFVGESKFVECPNQKAIESDKNWKSLMSKANGCINKGQWAKVESIGERISYLEPDAPWGAYYLSVASENKGHTERAMWMINLALKKVPEIGVLKYQKGRILWKQQFYKEAIAEMERAIELDKNLKGAHLFLGQVNLKELDFEKSKTHFQSVLLAEPRNHDALLGLASCYIELENLKEALSVIDRGIANFPKELDFRLQEVYVYENLVKDPVTALNKYKQLHSLMTSKKIKGVLPFNIVEKIKNLEDVTQKTRQLASQNQEKKNKN